MQLQFRHSAASVACAVARLRSAAIAGIVLAAAVAAGGCAGNQHEQMMSFLQAGETPTATGHYTIMPPDVVTIHAPGAREVDGVQQRVRPDGKVSLRLLGEVQLAGLTTQEAAEKLRTQLARYYQAPEVVVEVSRYSSQYYYVFGEVASPGAKPFTGRDTLLRALADAGPTFLAWRAQIRVVRPKGAGRESDVIVVDLDRMVQNGNTEENVLLQPGDIVEVPPTPLAWMGHRIRELLYPIEPAVNTFTRPAAAVGAYETYEDFGDDDDDTRVFISR